MKPDPERNDERRRDAIDVAGLYVILLVVVAILALVPMRTTDLDGAAMAVATKQEILSAHPAHAAAKASHDARPDAGARRSPP